MKIREVTIFKCLNSEDVANYNQLLTLLSPEFIRESLETLKPFLDSETPYKLTDETWPIMHTLLQARPSELTVIVTKPYRQSYMQIKWPFTGVMNIFLSQLEQCNIYEFVKTSKVFKGVSVLDQATAVAGIEEGNNEKEDNTAYFFYSVLLKAKLLYCALVSHHLQARRYSPLKTTFSNS